VFAMSNNDSGTEVIIQNNQGVEVQVLKSYGVGLDVHSGSLPSVSMSGTTIVSTNICLISTPTGIRFFPLKSG
jgi:hypothetical protein